MSDEDIVTQINNFIGQKISSRHNYFVDSKSSGHRIEINTADLVRVCRELKNTEPFYFLQLTDITAVDFPEKDKRFQLIYILYSFKLNHRLQLELTTNRENNLPSLGEVWSIAEVLEDEISARFGLFFSKNPDARNSFFKNKSSIYPLRKSSPARARFNAKNRQSNS